MKNKLIYLGITLLTSVNIYAQVYLKEGYFIDNKGEKTEGIIRYKPWVKTPVSFEFKDNSDAKFTTKGIEDVTEFKLYETDHYYKRFTLNVNVFDDQLNLIKKEGEQLFLKVLLESDKTLYVLEDKQDIFFFSIENQLHLLKFAEEKSKFAKNREFQKQLYEHLFCEGFNVSKYAEIKYNAESLVGFFKDYFECKNFVYANFFKDRRKVEVDLKAIIGGFYTPKITSSVGYIYAGEELYRREDPFSSQFSYALGFDAEFTYTNDVDKWRLFVQPNFQYTQAGSSSYDGGLYQDLLNPSNYEPGLELMILEMPIGIRRYLEINDKTELFLSAAYAYNVFLGGEASLKVPQNNEGKQKYKKSSFIIGLGATFNKKYLFSLNYYISKQSALDNLVSVDADGSIGFVFGYQLF